jgi:HNH endonuclease
VIDDETKDLVRTRSGSRCEYCRLPEWCYAGLFQIEHIVARSHGGKDETNNLALACRHCNLHKGPNLSGVDPVSSQLTRLFNPRIDVWDDHFAVERGVVRGLTGIGRTTVYVLNMNTEHRIGLRLALHDLQGYDWWRQQQ